MIIFLKSFYYFKHISINKFDKNILLSFNKYHCDKNKLINKFMVLIETETFII